MSTRKLIMKAQICLECGIFEKSCGWACNEDETYETYCCRFCDVDGSNYNGWAERTEASVPEEEEVKEVKEVKQ